MGQAEWIIDDYSVLYSLGFGQEIPDDLESKGNISDDVNDEEEEEEGEIKVKSEMLK